MDEVTSGLEALKQPELGRSGSPYRSLFDKREP